VDLVERSRYDMSFRYFPQMAPEEAVIDPSSLTKFRKLRLKDLNLLDLRASVTRARIPRIEKSQAAGMNVEVVIGDTAYSEKDNVTYSKENNMHLSPN
jgi:hypothetical protein